MDPSWGVLDYNYVSVALDINASLQVFLLLDLIVALLLFANQSISYRLHYVFLHNICIVMLLFSFLFEP